MTLYELVGKLSPVSFDELVYQAEKHKIEVPVDQMLDALRFLEGQGLVKCELRITDVSQIEGTP